MRIPSARELVADAVVHALGLGLGVVGVVAILVVTLDSPSNGGPTSGRLLPIGIYAAGLIAMLACSATYNILRKSPRRDWLRRLDHAAIFVMIAGTYTPFTVLAFPEPWSSGLTVAVWTAAAAGVAFKLWRPLRWERLSVVLYLALGWIGVIAVDPFLRSLATPTLVLLLAGGLVYSAGVAFHVASHRRYQNAAWHGCVLVAACTHYAAVFTLVA
jgi:hemolysin III